MMQNNPMGAMMPQGVAPAASTGLNFQSDPSMRAQFKGFMSGMQAKQPAPAAPMMQQPLPIPPSMQNIDIFQPSMPVKSYFMGGSVDYSDPYESAGTAGTVNFSSGGYEQEAFGDSGDGNRYDSSGNTVNFTSASAPPTASDGDPVMDALSQALANTAKANAAEQARQQATIDPALSQRLSEVQLADVTPGQIGGAPQSLTGAGRAVDTIFDIDTTAPDLLSLDALGGIGPDVNLEQFGGSGGFIPGSADIPTPTSRPEGLGPNFVSPSIQPMTSKERTQMELDEAGRDASIGAGMNEGQISGAPSLGFDLGGMGAEGEAVPAPSSAVQQAIDEARAKGGDTTTVELGPKGDYSTQFEQVRDIPGYDPNAEVPGIFTTAKGNAAMDKLLDRAQNFKESGIGGFLNKITGGRANFANRMASDIINKGYTPIFDRAGNIVATRNPETGQLGAGSVEARIPGMAGSGGGGGAPQMSVADQVAAALKRLGIGEDDEGDKAPPMIVDPPVAGPGLPILPPVNPPTEAAQVGNPLGLGYGQISGLTPNLNSAADDFLRMLGGGR